MNPSKAYGYHHISIPMVHCVSNRNIKYWVGNELVKTLQTYTLQTKMQKT